MKTTCTTMVAAEPTAVITIATHKAQNKPQAWPPKASRDNGGVVFVATSNSSYAPCSTDEARLRARFFDKPEFLQGDEPKADG